MKPQCPGGSNALIGRNIGTDRTRSILILEISSLRVTVGQLKKNEKRKKNKCASEPILAPFVKRVFIFLRELADIPPNLWTNEQKQATHIVK